jgi:hypothetical protein
MKIASIVFLHIAMSLEVIAGMTSNFMRVEGGRNRYCTID